MSNDWFSDFERLVKGSRARAEAVNALFDQVVTGMDKMPTEAQMNRETRNYAVDTGLANAYAVSLSHVSVAYEDGQEVIFLTANPNTGNSTLNVSTINDDSLVLNNGSELPSGTIQANSLVSARWNTTLNKWQLSGVFEITQSVTAFVATLLDDNNAVEFLATLGITASSSELNTLDGITSSTSELNNNDEMTAGITMSYGDFAKGSHTFSSVLTTASAEILTIAHGLGTDDIDFGFKLLGSVDKGLFSSGLMTDANDYIVVHTSPIYISSVGVPAGTPAAGNLAIKAVNGSASTQDITIDWWARKR